MHEPIHDIKTERQNVSAGLPAVYKIAPAAFYVVAAAATLLSFYFLLSKRAYQASEAAMQGRLHAAQSEAAGLVAQQQSIVDEAKKAEAYAKWLEGCRPLQPVTVAVGRSMGKESTVAELSLTRNPEIPAHTLMQLKIDGGTGGQIENTLDAIYALSYQTYSAQQVKGPNSTDFQAILIHTEN